MKEKTVNDNIVWPRNGKCEGKSETGKISNVFGLGYTHGKKAWQTCTCVPGADVLFWKKFEPL